MTHRASPHLDTAPERFWPAWLFSLVFHSFAIVVLGLVIQAAPRGTDRPGHSAGIVLNTANIDSEHEEGDEGGNEALAAMELPLQSAEWLSVEPSEPPPLVVESATHLPPLIRLPTPNSRATTTTGVSQPGVAPSDSGGVSSRGTPGGQGHARVSVFGVQGAGDKFVYLFDCSSSMEGAPLAAAKRQLLESLASLESAHQFHVVFFNTRTLAFELSGGGRRFAFATDRNKHLAAKFVGGITADGGTDRLTALKRAIGFAPDVIFFLTDADDPMSPGELAEIARENSRARAAICTIEFGRRQSPSPGSFLAELARQSGGQYGHVNTATLTQ